MATIEVEVIIKRDGRPLEYLRTVRRIELDEIQEFKYEKATGGGFVTLPTGELDEIQALVFQAVDQVATLRLDGQSDAGIVLNAGGMVVIIDCDIDAGAATNATVDNSSGSVALLRGLAGGT